MFSAPPRATTLLRVAARAALQHGKSTMNNLEIDWKDFEKWTTERNPDECYRYTDCGGCAVAQYLQDKYPGAKWVNIGDVTISVVDSGGRSLRGQIPENLVRVLAYPNGDQEAVIHSFGDLAAALSALTHGVSA